MRTSKRKYEGLLVIDHKESPGITPEQARGLWPAVGKGQILETHTYNCIHCQRTVVMNQLRTRPRVYCQKCDDYVCDECEAARVLNPDILHRSFTQVMEDAQNAGALGIPVEVVLRGTIFDPHMTRGVLA